MFGKLLKNDLKAQYHKFSVIFLCIAIISVASELISIFAKGFIPVLASMLLLFVLGFGCVIVVIAVAVMFNNTIFGRAGYLTLSLPVKTGSLIRSKTASGLIWLFGMYALFIVSFVLLVFRTRDVFGEEMAATVEDLLSIFGVPSFFSIFTGCVFIGIWLAIALLLVVQCIYLAITLSNVAPLSKLGSLGAIIMFFVLVAVVFGITGKISKLTSIGFVIGEKSLYFVSDIREKAASLGTPSMQFRLVGTLLQLAAAIGLHYPITYLVKNKINVK